MIIELFGPPAAGKTTFARALAARLGERGHTVDLILSQRPAEGLPHEIRSTTDLVTPQISPMMRRLTRPFGEILTIARYPSTIPRDVGMALNLIKILPPTNALWLLRLAQYVSRLSRAWFQASNAGRIVLFDQAFVQAVCSLVLLSGVEDEIPVTNALDAIPKSDLLIRLDAPIEILKARLRERQRLESRIERLLELDSATSLRSLAIVDYLHDLLRKGDSQIMNAASLDQHSLDEAVERIEKQLMAQFNIEQHCAARRNQACSDSLRVDQTLKRRTAS